MAFRAVIIVWIAVASAADATATLVGFLFGADLFYTFLHQTVFFAFFGQFPVAPFIAACDPVTVGAC